ncbi:MAG: sigma-70 family RNA polymerase sigma factor [Myxococcota bacterium]|nr:sigma-70 family RNA polymerase sigma factor [Myxococcota bacterium]
MQSVELHVDDEILVEKLRLGDDRAFQTLFVRYARYVAGVIYRLIGNDANLDDIVQETFLAAARGIKELSDPKKLKLWLVTIAVRHTGRSLTRQKRHTALKQALMQQVSSIPNDDDDERIQEIYDALNYINPKLRIPWFLNKVEGFTIAQLTSICNCSSATIKRRIKQADDRLKRRLHAV